MVISTDARKAFDTIQYPFMIKNTLTKVGIEGSFFGLIKNIYKNLQITSYLMVKRLNYFLLRSGTSKDVYSQHFYLIFFSRSPSHSKR